MSNRQGGLGRGLGALIPSDVTDDASSAFQTVAVSAIQPNAYQPREHFDEATLDSLTASVRELGVLQPLLVRRTDEGFELIAGERRWRAAKRAGLTDVPVIVREADDMGSLEQALVENLHRQDLNALEEAAAYQQLVDEFSMTQEQVATRVGKSRSAVANTLRLLALPTAIQRYLTDGRLSAGHCRALLVVEDADEQVALADQIVADELTVRATEALLKSEPSTDEGDDETASTEDADRVPRAPRVRSAAELELEDRLSDHLSTSVAVAMTTAKGKITIDFADLDDLERLSRIILTGRNQ